MEKNIKEQLMEAIAAVQHDAWMHWAKAVSPEVSEERKLRWEAFMVPYDQLDESTKDMDREWAEEVIEAIEPIWDKLSGGRVKETVTKVEVDSKIYPALSGVLKG